MKEKINNIMDRVAELVSDLENPAQNPAYEGPTKDEIIETLKNVLSIHSIIEAMYEDSFFHDEYKDDMDRTFENITERIDDAIRHLEHALDDIRNR